MLRRPSITDWIQALVVVIGIAFALWEFVLRDREDEHDRREAVRNMISASQSNSVFKAYQALFSFYRQYKNAGRISEGKWDDILHAVTPLKEHFLTWAYCYANSLCNEELALKYVCFRVLSYEELMKHLATKAHVTRGGTGEEEDISVCYANVKNGWTPRQNKQLTDRLQRPVQLLSNVETKLIFAEPKP